LMNIPAKRIQNARGRERKSENSELGWSGGLIEWERPRKQKTLPPFGKQGCLVGLQFGN
jgi:hypothetical protein